jgi:predicted nucleic acid-binding Zn ribbon protein
MIKHCLVCKKEYKGRNKYTCSMACFAIYKSHKKKCVVCGREFYDSPSNDTITCSTKCSTIHRKHLHEQGVYAGTLEKAHVVAKTNPLIGRFDTHMHAKTWRIQSPDGKIHECRNLLNWLREHEDILDGTVRQAWDGITKIKYSMQGKRKFKSYQWKGWKLLEWGDN